ncbi:hypothetical protein BGZ91_002196 [Linnemannia elongata]|nr:hypothetical protein BGZ91_002196 [Linnemannia elongata]
MFMFLDGSSTGDTPIRVELEANAIRHRGNYVFEIVLSEDISSYMNPSPSSCHRVFDSLYHEIVATSHPDPSTFGSSSTLTLQQPLKPLQRKRQHKTGALCRLCSYRSNSAACVMYKNTLMGVMRWR